MIPDSEKILIHPVIHVSNLKSFTVTPERFIHREMREDPPDPIPDMEGGTEFLVDEILAWRMYRNKRQFLIKWTGHELPSWEPEHILMSSPDFKVHLQEFINENVPVYAAKRGMKRKK